MEEAAALAAVAAARRDREPAARDGLTAQDGRAAQALEAPRVGPSEPVRVAAREFVRPSRQSTSESSVP
jgi:hypothetical protein